MDWDPPKVCRNEHKLEPPNVKVGWMPCRCSRADGAPTGHMFVVCNTCGWEWHEGGCDHLRITPW